MAEVKLPQLAEGVESATITYWHFKQGERVREGQDIVELATDKATFNLAAPATGILSEIYFNEGDSAQVGSVLATIS